MPRDGCFFVDTWQTYQVGIGVKTKGGTVGVKVEVGSAQTVILAVVEKAAVFPDHNAAPVGRSSLRQYGFIVRCSRYSRGGGTEYIGQVIITRGAAGKVCAAGGAGNADVG